MHSLRAFLSKYQHLLYDRIPPVLSSAFPPTLTRKSLSGCGARVAQSHIAGFKDPAESRAQEIQHMRLFCVSLATHTLHIIKQKQQNQNCLR